MSARECPNSIALADGTRTLSYGELEFQADRFAARLKRIGVTEGDTVVLCMERSFEWIVAALGSMRAGAAYVPLDPAWPDSRVRFAVTDCGAKAFAGTKDRFERVEVEAKLVDPFLDEDAIAEISHVSAPSVDPQSLAYIVYTSGSTGVPKGVEITHANLNHLVRWHLNAFGLTNRDRTSHLAGLGFDASVWEIWPTLCAGATLCLADNSTRFSGETIQRWMLKERITIGFVPTVYAAPMMSMQWPEATALRFLLTGGDKLQSGPPAPLPFKVVNNYGPAECTVVATSHVLVPGEEGAPPIGRAIAGATVYVLDEDGRPVADGVAGEIYVGGDGVGRGYRGLPDATSRAFLKDPFASAPGARVYRTGDRAIRRPDGTLEFRGRVDRQIKIRGQRVELDEIGNALARHPSIGFAIATTRTSREGSSHLIAHFLPADKARVPAEQDLKAHLRATLPDYMVPSLFVQLDTVPVSANGKIDLHRLPDPPSLEEPAEPATGEGAKEVERKLMQIVRDLLGGQSISEHDNLFLSGGHSLFGMQLLTRVRAEFGVDLTLEQLFEAPTVHGLALLIEGNHGDVHERLNQPDAIEAAVCSCSGSATAARLAHGESHASTEMTMASSRAEFTPFPVEATARELKEDIDRCSGVLALHREGRRTPIFWVHNLVIGLANELGDDQPFMIVLLTATDLRELGARPSLRDVAARFLAKILAVQPAGPFILGGLCVGSVLVYEIAQQMRAAGLEVGLLILLDAATQPYLSSCTKLSAKLSHPGYSLKRARQIGLGQTLVNVRKRLFKSIPFSLRLRMFKPDWDMTHEMIGNAAFVYYPQPYDGEVLLLLSANAPRHLDFLPGWQKVVEPKLTVAYVDGHHRDFITSENVGAIARIINQSLAHSAISSPVLADLANSA